MAMLITKFHRLIRSKLLWITFLVVVIFSFVIWGTQMPETGAQGPTHAGKLDGDTISFDEYQRARFNTYLAVVLMSGRHIPITPEVDDQLYEMAWQRIASLRKAEAYGLSTSNDEVINTIRTLEFLQSNGTFSQQAYDQFARQFLEPMRAGKRDFEEHIRQEIMLQKLRMIVDRTILITPHEIQRTFNTLTDSFEIEFVTLDTSLVAADVTVSEEDIIAYFEKEPDQFMLPEKVRIKSAVFAVADFTDAANISDEEIEEYYDFNMEDYALPRDPAEETNMFSIAATEYRPLEDVKEEIRDTLVAREAIILAEARANEFVQELSARRNDGRTAFDKIAEEWGIELFMVPAFSSRELPIEMENGPAVARAAFNLTDDNDYYYSDPVKGTNFIYVLALVDRMESRLPVYEEVKSEVEAMALDLAIYNALAEKAREIRESAVAGLTAGLTFADVLAAYELTSVKPAPFTLNSQDLDPLLDTTIVRNILTHNQGEVTEPIETADGFAIAYVKSRTPDNLATVESFRPQIVSTLRRQNSPVAFNDLQNYLLKKGDFEDNLRRRPATKTGESADEES